MDWRQSESDRSGAGSNLTCHRVSRHGPDRRQGQQQWGCPRGPLTLLFTTPPCPLLKPDSPAAYCDLVQLNTK